MKELTPEEEEGLIEKGAELIINQDLETVALLFLGTMMPGAYVLGQYSRVFLAPFLPFFGDAGYDLISVFEKRGNVEKIIKKVDDARTKKEKKKESSKKDRKDSWLKRNWKKLIRR